MPLIVKPFTFSAGAIIVASQHNSNTDTVYNLVNGTLDTTNLAANAAIADTQLAQITTAGKVSVASLTGTGQALATYITTLTGVINLIIDGGGSAITTGVKLDVYLPIGLTITESTLLADQSGSIVLDLWVDTYSAYPPTIADTITASAKPTLSSATKAQDATLTGWTAAIAAGKSLRVNVDSASTVTRVVLALKYVRTT